MPKTEPTNEEEVKRAAELREWLEARMLELENELGRLKDMQHVVDSVLRKSSFVPAAELKVSQTKIARAEKVDNTKNDVAKSADEPRQLPPI